jgi:hypothetical protein
MAGDISSDLVTAGLITAGAGFVTGQPEVISMVCYRVSAEEVSTTPHMDSRA